MPHGTTGTYGPIAVPIDWLLGIQMAAVIILMPQVVKHIMTGLLPVSERAKTMFQQRFENSKFYIGLDCALLLGDSAVVTAYSNFNLHRGDLRGIKFCRSVICRQLASSSRWRSGYKMEIYFARLFLAAGKIVCRILSCTGLPYRMAIRCFKRC